MAKPTKKYPSKDGYYGDFGGRFVSELLMPALTELEQAYNKFAKTPKFKKQLKKLLSEYAGRPTRLYYAPNLSKKWQAKVYLKREDLLHTGAHKINNTLGQALLAQYMGKKRIIAETGAGQHGVATATACALFNLPAVVYMGGEDMRRQEMNVFRMQLMGTDVVAAGGEKGTLRDAINDALRDWANTVGDTHYIIGSVVGPHPFPKIVRDFQSVIGKETIKQIAKAEKSLPHAVIACVGGGSNAMGMFYPIAQKHPKVKLIGVEAGGFSLELGRHSSTLTVGSPGILHGTLSYLLQNKEGQVADVHSVSAGLDYPSVGPEHAFFKDKKKAKYVSISDEEALEGFSELSQTEGIIPALESSHAIAHAKKFVKSFRAKHKKKPIVIVNLSGRGDKDVAEAKRVLAKKS